LPFFEKSLEIGEYGLSMSSYVAKKGEMDPRTALETNFSSEWNEIVARKDSGCQIQRWKMKNVRKTDL